MQDPWQLVQRVKERHALSTNSWHGIPLTWSNNPVKVCIVCKATNPPYSEYTIVRSAGRPAAPFPFDRKPRLIAKGYTALTHLSLCLPFNSCFRSLSTFFACRPEAANSCMPKARLQRRVHVQERLLSCKPCPNLSSSFIRLPPTSSLQSL